MLFLGSFIAFCYSIKSCLDDLMYHPSDFDLHPSRSSRRIEVTAYFLDVLECLQLGWPLVLRFISCQELTFSCCRCFLPSFLLALIFV